jgi:hypothetical protein
METQRIELRKDRDFGQVFNAVFAFIKQEFKPLGISVLVFVLPVVLILAIIHVQVIQPMAVGISQPSAAGGVGMLYGKLFKMYAYILGFSMLIQTIIVTTIFSYLNLYISKVKEITIGEMFLEVRYNILSVFAASFVTYILMIIGLVFCIFPGIYLAIIFGFFVPALIFEQQGFSHAFGRSFQIGNYRWWWSFLLVLVSFILISVVSFVISSPLFVVQLINTLHGTSKSLLVQETWYMIYTAISTTIGYLLYCIPVLMIGFQYFSIVEARDRHLLNEEIDKIGEDA